MKKIVVTLICVLLVSACTPSNEHQTTFTIDDFVSIIEIDGKTLCDTDACRNSTEVFTPLQDISFSKIDNELIEPFIKQHNDFLASKYLDPMVDAGYRLQNAIHAEIQDGILFVYETQESLNHPLYNKYDTYSLALDLNSMKRLDNKKILEHFNIPLELVYTKLFEDSLNKIHIDFLLESTNGNIEAPKISLTDYKNNIPKYVNELESAYETAIVRTHDSKESYAVVYYVEDGKLKCNYNLNNLLYLVGLGSHMGIGLENTFNSINLN